MVDRQIFDFEVQAMPTYNVEGIPVEFPYTAYDCQLRYMEAVVKALCAGENALLESPTGTGKTLCLLCATLAWRRHRMDRIKENSVSWEAQADPNAPRATGGVPRIWYSSRTHSQLKQVIKELKRTSYKPASVVLGSREQLCVHSSVSRKTGAQQNACCKRAIDEKRCPFYTGLKRGSGTKVDTSCRDIEEVVTVCKSAGICPFFKTREDAKSAELMLIPYDYLINPQTRESLNLGLNGNILIFDEGHNIERTCEEIASFELRCEDIAKAMQEIDDACTALDSPDVMMMGETLNEMTADMLQRHLLLLKRHFYALEDTITNEKLEPDAATGKYLMKKPGSYMKTIFARGSDNGDGMHGKDLQRVVGIIRKAIAVLTFNNNSPEGGVYLNKMSSLITTLFKANDEELSTNYQVLMYEDEDDKKGKGKGNKRKVEKVTTSFFDKDDRPKGSKTRVLCLWCFSCSVAMRELQKHGVHSIMITSGTLAPIQGTLASFGVPFPVVLENKHVIDSSKQLWGGVLSAGPEKHLLDASYEQRNQPGYLRDLGMTVAAFARFVPDGILVAFTSYFQKTAVLKAWKDTGLYEEISKYKPIYDEPKSSTEMKQVLERFTNTIERSSPAGAILTAVCRGKLTEGIDFTDKQCRLVIMVGIPYPAKNDLRVVMKQNFLDTTGSAGDGRKWYNREAIRAVNQTIGRVIRHKNDFGAVVLCDGRYAKDWRLSYLASGLSAWLQPSISIPKSFVEAEGNCRAFFGKLDATRDASLNPMKPSAAATSDRNGKENAGGADNKSEATAPSNTTSARSAASGGGVPLSVLGALFKKQKQMGAEAVLASLGPKRPASPAVNVSSSQDSPSNGPSAATAPASSRPAVSSSAGAMRRIGAFADAKLAPAQSQTVGIGSIKAWLEKAHGLLPIMHYNEISKLLPAIQAQADVVSGMSGNSQVQEEAGNALVEAMRQTAKLLLPMMSFDDADDQLVRTALVRDYKHNIPRLVWPLWKKTVDEVLASQGRPGAFAT